MLSQGRKKDEESVGRRNLRVRLALERIAGRPLEDDGYVSKAMQDGTTREPDALSAYEALTGSLVQSSGFLAHADLMAGTSLDGHIGDYEGIVEIKCPTPAVHLEYLRSDTIPTSYLRQVTHALWITGAAWCDWLSYQPDFPEPLRLRIVRLTRESIDLARYNEQARAFLAEVDREVEAIRTMANPAAQLVAALETV